MTEAKEVVCSDHPDYPGEKGNLKKTVQIIATLTEVLRQDLQLHGLNSPERDELTYDPSMEVIEMYVQKSKEEDLYDLIDVESTPYFARVDFREDGHVRPVTYYIGRTGVTEFRKGFNPGTHYVIDWRTPVAAGLFYQAKNGRASVEAPGESYTGDLLLKRHFEIESKTLYNFTDDDSMSNFLGDKFLVSKLLQGTNQRLKDIVSTIQREQDEIIRRPLHEVTLVQGVAGSGKTTVGLHRIAYLIYTHNLTPARVAVIGPNRLFMSYIANVLPGLHTDGVWQGTFEELAESVTGLSFIGNRTDAVTEFIKEHGWQDDDAHIQWIRLRGSLAYRDLLDHFLADWRKNIAFVMADIEETIGPDRRKVQLSLSREGPVKRLQDDSIPLNKVIQGINSYIRRRLTDQVRQKLDLYEVKTSGRGKHQELVELPIPAAYQKDLEKCIGRYSLSTLTADQFFGEFLRSDAITNVRKTYGLGPVAARAAFDQEDAAALCYLHLKLTGGREDSSYDHIMVDEVQDRNAFELFILALLSKRKSLTLLGDINQAIHSYRSFRSWKEVEDGISPFPVSFYIMRTSYRSAAEVVQWCNRLILDPDFRGIPVYSVNESPGVTCAQTIEEAVNGMAKVINDWKRKGIRSIGIIARESDECKRLYDTLRTLLPREEIQLIAVEAGELKQGIAVLSIALAKGLEFDGVIVANAGKEQFQDTVLDRNLLYVALSRALYRLHVFCIGSITSHLKEKGAEEQ